MDPFAIQYQDNSIKDNKIDDYYEQELEGSFWFGGRMMTDSLRLSVAKKRIMVFFALIILGLLLLLGRIFYLQIYQGDYYRGIAEGNRIRIKTVRSNRGIIFDRKNQLLVQNVPQFSLFLIPADLPKDKNELNKIIQTIAQILEQPEDEINKMILAAPKYSYEPVLTKEDIPYDKAMVLKIKSAELAGVVLDIIPIRKYLETGYGLGHVLGYMGKLDAEEYKGLKDAGYLINDYLGKSAIEGAYEKLLRGKYGKERVEVDFLGKEEKILSVLKPEAGKDLILAIDLDLQKKATSALESQMEKAKAKSGAVLVTDVNSGEILALVSLPDYDNNLFAHGISNEDYKKLMEDEGKPLYNRAISGEYPPGSTFKLVEAAGALESGIIDKETYVFSTGGIWVGKWFFPDWKAGGHGKTTVTKAIAESVNTFFYYVGGGFEDFKGLGLEKINYWAYLFGLGQKLGVDLIGEEIGFLPTEQWKLKTKNESWYIGDTYHLAIGQGDLLVTPLQLNDYTAAVANGGILYQPRLARGYFDRENDKKYFFKPKIIRKDFVSDSNLAIVREGMRDGVIYGSSRALSNLNVEVAGKTGTAQVGGDKQPHAWFTGFAPYSKPEIAITVLIENGGEGSTFAVPVAKEILGYYFENVK